MHEKEYIEREAAKKKHCEICLEKCICYRSKTTCDELKAFDLIPAADVRPVVYCRECKHYKPQEKKSARWDNRSLMCTRSATIKMPPDGFCSFGKKTDVTDINVGNKNEAE